MASVSTSKSFPGFGALYELSEPGAVHHFRASLDLTEDPYAVTRAEVQPARPVRARWMMGRKEPVDIVWTGHAVPVLVSDRIREIFRGHGFAGWSTYEVELHAKSGDLVPGYSGLSVPGRCGPIDNNKSIPVPKQFPAKISTVWKGLYFDPTTWDGSDLFMPEGKVGWIFVTEALKRALEEAKVKNVVFTPLDHVERSMLL